MGDGELLLRAFERARTGLALIDTTGIIQRVNPAGAAIVGRTSEELAGTQLLDLIASDDQLVALAELGKLPQQGYAGPLELKTTRPDGTVAWLQAQGTVLQEPDAGSNGTVYVSFEDVSDVHGLSERYDAAVAELRAEHATRLTRARAFADFAALTARSSAETDAQALLEGITDVAIQHLADLAAVVLLDEHDPRTRRISYVRHRDPEAERDLRERLAKHPFGAPFGPLGAALTTGVPNIHMTGPLHPEMPAALGAWISEHPMGDRHIYPMQSPGGR